MTFGSRNAEVISEESNGLTETWVRVYLGNWGYDVSTFVLLWLVGLLSVHGHLKAHIITRCGLFRVRRLIGYRDTSQGTLRSQHQLACHHSTSLRMENCRHVVMK